jgi:glycosyltransferase involved in cell wall biosynthesis
MRIAQVSPLYESVPPRLYGGTERVVHWLTEELVRMGHDVTLFASGDSRTSARLVSPCDQALRLANCVDPLAYHILMLGQVFSERFDIVHFHIDYMHFPMSMCAGISHVTTLHGRLDLPELVPVYRHFLTAPVISISDAQRKPLPWAAWQRTVYHGMPADLHTLGDGSGGYLVFLGRISPEKQPDVAIEIAKRAGRPLKIAAKVDRIDQAYFDERIKPLLDHPLIEFLGEVGYKDKDTLLRNASALLFPIDWPEPFGIVMIEAMACGTPVIAFDRGSVPEIIEDGVSGFIVQGVEDAVLAVERLDRIDRRGVRRAFERRFTASRMAGEYLQVYEKLLAGRRHRAA